MATCDPFDEKDILLILNSKAFGCGIRARNQCIFVLGCCTGARISELLGLRRADILDEIGEIRGKITFTRTKNKCPRTVPIVNHFLLPYLKAWLVAEQKLGFCLSSSPLFPSIGRGRPIGRQWILSIYKRAARECGIKKRIGTHSCRKTWAKATYEYYQKLLMKGEKLDPLVKLQEAGGWKDIDAARRYLNFMLGDVLDSHMSLYSALKHLTKS